MTHLQMYWFTRLDIFNTFGWFGGLVLLLIAVFTFGYCLDERKTPLLALLPLIPAIFLILCGLLVPTQKEAAAIWLVPKMVNNQRLNNIASNTLSIVDEYTKEYLSDLLSDKKEKPTSPSESE